MKKVLDIKKKSPISPMPKCFKKSSKPSKFCPGCGHPIVLKMLGEAIDELGIARKVAFGIDIGCSLLAWDFFDLDTIQTHHGRTVPVMVGFKKANPTGVAIAYVGDGGAYAIGLQSLIHAALKNIRITVITVNNTLYAMTGGQVAPTTLPYEVTDSSPDGAFTNEKPLFGPELLTKVGNSPDFYLARGSVAMPGQLKDFIQRALLHQIEGKGFSFVEALSYCPVNWKKDAKGCIEFISKMNQYFQVGEIR